MAGKLIYVAQAPQRTNAVSILLDMSAALGIEIGKFQTYEKLL
jgi:hypothetical protein